MLRNVIYSTPQKKTAFYSGKKRRHTLKAQIVTSEGKILCTNFAPGSVHDFKLFKLSRLPFRKDTLVVADTGYLGIELINKKNLIPKKSSKLRRLTLKDKYYNRIISKLRIGVEHLIKKIKCFRIFSERYRCRHKTFKKRFNLICAVINLDLPT